MRPEVDDPDPSWPEVVAAVAVRTLVVGVGVLAASSPAEHVAELLAVLPEGRSVTLDTGHEVHAADPVGFVREVLAFLRRLTDSHFVQVRFWHRGGENRA